MLRGGWAVLAACGLALSSGCQSTLDMTGLQEDPVQTTDVQGPMERFLRGSWRSKPNSSTYDQALTDEAYEHLDEAQKLFEEQRHAEAAKRAKQISKRYRETPAHEEALFLLAEAQFAQQRYSLAQDSYDQLLIDYPSTRYMDRVTKRLFEIAHTWLDFPTIATRSEIMQVSRESADGEPLEPPKEPGRFPDPTRAVPILPNFHDRSRPVFDTKGRALQALKSIWLNDPTGPLADDSLMLTASYYLRKGDFVESDRYFQILREEYPKSPHLENAFLLGSHVKLMSYQGPRYDGTRLTEARNLKESALRLFPETADRERLREELSRIAEAEARRDWSLVEFYQRKGKPRAVAVYCNEILENHPRSSYAEKARELLAQLSREGALAAPQKPAGFRFPRLRPVPSSDDDSSSPESSDSESPAREYDEVPSGSSVGRTSVNGSSS